MPPLDYNVEVLPSTARTATVDSIDLEGLGRGVHVVIDVTAKTGTPSVVPKIQGKDPISGKYYDLLEGSAISTVSTVVLKVYPGIAVSANVSANDILPPVWRVRMEHGNTDSITYSVSAAVLA